MDTLLALLMAWALGYMLWDMLKKAPTKRHIRNNPAKGWDTLDKSSAKRRTRTPSGKGYVYVAENPEIPGKVKIGYTTRDVRKRMKELSSGTGVPGKYTATYKFRVARPKHVEKTVHRKLSHRKIQDGGEFFKVTPKEAARVIKKVRS